MKKPRTHDSKANAFGEASLSTGANIVSGSAYDAIAAE